MPKFSKEVVEKERKNKTDKNLSSKHKQKIEYLSLAQAAEFCDYSQDYLSLRARSGKLKAKKLGRNWYTTKEWLGQYLEANGKCLSSIRDGLLRISDKEELQNACELADMSSSAQRGEADRKISSLEFLRRKGFSWPKRFALAIASILIIANAGAALSQPRAVRVSDIAPAANIKFFGNISNQLRIANRELKNKISGLGDIIKEIAGDTKIGLAGCASGFAHQKSAAKSNIAEEFFGISEDFNRLAIGLKMQIAGIPGVLSDTAGEIALSFRNIASKISGEVENAAAKWANIPASIAARISSAGKAASNLLRIASRGLRNKAAGLRDVSKEISDDTKAGFAYQISNIKNQIADIKKLEIGNWKLAAGLKEAAKKSVLGLAEMAEDAASKFKVQSSKFKNKMLSGQLSIKRKVIGYKLKASNYESIAAEVYGAAASLWNGVKKGVRKTVDFVLSPWKKNDNSELAESLEQKIAQMEKDRESILDSLKSSDEERSLLEKLAAQETGNKKQETKETEEKIDSEGSFASVGGQAQGTAPTTANNNSQYSTGSLVADAPRDDKEKNIINQTITYSALDDSKLSLTGGTITGALNVAGLITGGQLSILGDSNLAGGLAVQGPATLSNLTVTGGSIFESLINASGGLAAGNLSIDSQGNLRVARIYQDNSPLYITSTGSAGDIALSAGRSINIAAGQTIVDGNFDVLKGLNIRGADLKAYEDLIVANTGSADKFTNTGETLTAYIEGDMEVDGALYADSNIYLTDSLKVGDGTPDNVVLGSGSKSVFVTGDIEIDGTLYTARFKTPYANTFTAAKSGGDYTTIQAAINICYGTDGTDGECGTLASDNTALVLVAPGTYNEAIIMRDYIDVVSIGGYQSTIIAQADNAGAVVTAASNSTLEGFTISATGTPAAAAVSIGAASPNLIKNKITTAAADIYYAIDITNGSPYIEGNIIGDGIGSRGLRTSGSGSPVVIYNIFENTTYDLANTGTGTTHSSYNTFKNSVANNLHTVSGAAIESDHDNFRKVSSAGTLVEITGAKEYAVSGADETVGEAVYISAADTVDEAKADAAATMPAVGIIIKKISAARALVKSSGIYYDSAAPFTTGATYYVSRSTAGAITSARPAGELAQIVGYAKSTTELVLNLDAYLAPGYDNVITVAQKGGDYTSIQSAINACYGTDGADGTCGTLSSSNGALIRVMPGTYSESVTMRDYIDIIAAGGPDVTKITQTTSTVATTASNSRLQGFTISKTTDGAAAAITVAATSPTLENLAITGAGTASQIGISISSGNSEIRNLKFENLNTAISIATGSPVISDLTAIASITNGIIHSGASGTTTVRNSRISAAADITVSGNGGTVNSAGNYLTGTTNFSLSDAGATVNSYKDNYSTVAGAGTFNQNDYVKSNALAALTVRQNSTGNIAEFKDGSNSALVIADGGLVTIGNTTAGAGAGSAVNEGVVYITAPSGVNQSYTMFGIGRSGAEDSGANREVFRVDGDGNVFAGSINVSGTVSQGATTIIGDFNQSGGSFIVNSTGGYLALATDHAANAGLSISQTNTGNIIEAKDSGTIMFKIADGGLVSVANGDFTAGIANGAGDLFIENDLEVDGRSEFAQITAMFDNIIIADASGKADYATIDSAYTAAKTVFGAPSATNKVLVLVKPGVYTESLTFDTAYIYVYGEGRDVVEVKQTADITVLAVAASDTTIANLTLNKTNDGSNPVLSLASYSPKLDNIKITGAGTIAQTGISITSGSPEIEKLEIRNCFTAINITTGSPVISRASISTAAVGIYQNGDNSASGTRVSYSDISTAGDDIKTGAASSAIYSYHNALRGSADHFDIAASTTIESNFDKYDAVTVAATATFADLNGTSIYTEAAEAVAVGDAVYINGSGQAAEAKANADATMPAIGIVVKESGSNVYIKSSGAYYDNAVYSDFTSGAAYYVSASTAGSITSTKPAGEISQIIGYAKAANQLMLDFAGSGGDGYDNTIIVAKQGGDYASIQSAINACYGSNGTDGTCGTLSSTNGAVIKVMPGSYSEAITMRSFIDVVSTGGYEVAIITQSDSTIITGASNSRLEGFTLNKTTDNTNPIISAGAALGTYKDLNIAGAGVANQIAFSITSGSPIISDVKIDNVSAAITTATGSPTITNANIFPTVTGAVGVNHTGASGTTTIRDSRIAGTTDIYASGSGSTINSHSNLLVGTTNFNSATGATINSYKDSYTTVTQVGAFNQKDYIINSAIAALTVQQDSTGNIVDFKDGSNSVFVINDGGNVGINISGPDRKLDILDDTNPQMRLTHTDGSVYSEFKTDGNGDLSIITTGDEILLDAAETIKGSGALTIKSTTGDLTLESLTSGNFIITSAGNITQTYGGGQVIGAASDAIIIGNSGDTLALTSSDWAISTAGALTGITGITNDGSYTQTGTGTFSTGTGAISLNGATSVTGSNTFTVGTGLTTLGGDLSVTGTAWTATPTISGQVTMTSGFDSNAASTVAGLTVDTDGNLTVSNGTLSVTAPSTTGNAAAITANSLTSGNILSLTSNSTAAIAGNTGLNIAVSGANGAAAITRYGLKSAVTATNATSGTNIAGYFSASGATTANYGLIVENGYAGVGTTSPQQPLHVEGQCVTGDTMLTITNYELRITNSKEEYIEIPIKDIKPGMEVLSLNEETGKLEPARIKGLLDMGVKPIYKLTTESGKTIRTTGNHPYLVEITENQKTTSEEMVFQRGGEQGSRTPSAMERTVRVLVDSVSETLYSPSRHDNYYSIKAENIQNKNISNNEDAFDGPFLRNEVLSINTLQKQYNRSENIVKFSSELSSGSAEFPLSRRIPFSSSQTLGRATGTPFQGSDKLLASTFSDGGLSTQTSRLPEFLGIISKTYRAILGLFRHSAADSIVTQIKDDSNKNLNNANSEKSFQDFETRWMKVVYLKEGMKIAVVSGLGKAEKVPVAFGATGTDKDFGEVEFEKIVSIEQLPAEQVYDIEVEGTHNFVANGIIAHNTYINSIATDANVKGLQIAQSGAITGTGYGLHVAKTGASTTNVGGYFSASGATNNYGLIVENGNVGIGDASPAALLTVGANDLFQVNSSGAIAAVVGITNTGSYTQTGTGTFSTGTGAISLNGATSVTGSNTFTVGTGLTTLGGDLTVTGTAWTATPTISGQVTMTSGFDANAASTVAGLTVDGNGNLTVSNGTLSVTAPSTTGNAAAITANSLTSGNILSLTSNSTAAIAGNTGLNIAVSGANGAAAITRYGLKSAVTATNATSGTNIAGYFSASGATTANYGLIVENGYAGVGTTSPQQPLHVEGQCVTGDTMLTITNYELRITNSKEEYIEIPIKDIKPGMEVLSLNEETGKLEPARIKGLLDMGVKPIYKLTTESGKTIRTTGNHPYLVENKKSADMTDSSESQNDSRNLESTPITNSIADKNRLSRGNKNIFDGGSAGNRTPETQVSTLSSNHSGPTANLLYHEKFSVANIIENRINKKDRGTVTPRVYEDSQSVRSSYKNSITEQEFLSSGEGKWTKVAYLKEGMKIAVQSEDGKAAVWEEIVSIEQMPAEQVYDIEVEGTHNFVANGIIAHNTYINSVATDANVKGLQIAQSGAITGTGYGLHVAKTGASTTNVGGYFSASGATNNYGLIVENGNVGIGDATPAALLTVGANDLFQVNSSGAIAAVVGITNTGSYTQTGTGTFSTGTGAISLNGATSVTGSNTFTVGTGLTTLGGDLSVTGTAWTATPTISGQVTMTSGFDSNAASTVAGLTVDGNGNLTVSNGTLSVTAPSTTGNAAAITANSLTTGTGLNISSTSTAGGASGTSKLLNIARSGANAQLAHTAYGVYSSVTNTNVTSGTNIAGYFSASGATTANYGLIVENGNVGIGTTAPGTSLDVFRDNATGNSISSALLLERTTSATPAAGLGTALGYMIENSANAQYTAGRISTILTSVTSGSETARMDFFVGNGADNAGNAAALKMSINYDGNVGIGSTAPDKALEINSASGANLRLTYNDSNGTATYYSDFAMSDSGDLTISASGGDISFSNENLATTGTFSSAGITNTGSYTQTGTGTFSTGTGAISLNGATSVTGSNTFTVGTGLTTLGGDLSVTGTAWTATPTISGQVTMTSGFDSNAASTVAGLTVDTDGNLTVSNGTLSVTAPTTTGNAAAITANSLTTGTGLNISSTSTAGGASGTSKLLNIARSGANAQLAHTAYGVYSSVTNTNVTSGTNIAGYFSASGATTANYGLIVENGNVGIGDATPAALLTVGANDLFQVNSSGAIAAVVGITNTGSYTQTGTGTFSTGTGAISLNGATSVTGSNTFTVGTGLTTLGGDLSVTGTAWTAIPTISGAVTMTSGFDSNAASTVAGLTVDGNGNLTVSNGTLSVTAPTTTGNAAAITANSLTSGNILSLTSNSTAAIAGNTGLNIAVSGANGAAAITRYGLKSAVTATNATSGTNIAGYFSASGATTANYGLIVENGNVGIGTTAPDKALEINSVTGGNLRLTYNDSDGAATYYSDFAMSDSGDLTISASGGDISFSDENLATTGQLSAEHLISTDDADINDNLTVGDIIIDEAAGVLAFSGNTSASILTTSASNNILTLGGLSQTNNENLTFDFETTANKVLVSTGTGVTSVDFGTVNLETDYLDLSSGDIASAGNITGTGAVSGFTSVSGTTLTDGVLSITGGNLTNVGNITGAGAVTISSTAADLTLANITSGNIILKPSADSDDYFTFSTTGDIPTIYGTGSYLRVGDAGTTGHSLDAEDDLMVTGDLEVDGTSYFDGNIYTGALEFGTDAGLVTAFDMPVSSSAVDNTVEGYNFAVDGTNIVTVYSQSDGLGAIDTTRVGIGTIGPDRKLDILDASNPQLRLTQTDGTVYADMQVDSNGDLIMNVDGVSNQLVLDNGGNIGIGVADPESLLEIKDTDAHPILTLTAAHDTDYDPQIQFKTDSTDTVKFSMGVDGSDDKFKIYSGSGIGDTTELTIDTSGNIGIGTASPSTILDIQKSGTATADTDYLELTNSGNAAAMTNTRTSLLFNQYYYDAVTPAVADSAKITVGTEGNWTSTASTQDAFMAFFTAEDGVTSAEAMRIDSNGDVGIGNISPSAKLDVVTNEAASAALSVRQDGAGNIVEFKDGATNVFVIAGDGAATIGEATKTVAITSSGWGIGTTGSVTGSLDLSTATAVTFKPQTVSLVPEYPNSVYYADGTSNTGTLTSDYDSSSYHNYYRWTTSSDNQDYDIVIRWLVPEDFNGFDTSYDFKIYNKVSDTSGNTSVILSMKDTANAAVSFEASTTFKNASWTESSAAYTGSPTFDKSTSTTPKWITFQIKLTADNGDTADVGEISFRYNRQQ